MDNEKNVNLLCTLSGYYPKGFTLLWTKGNETITSNFVREEFKSINNGNTNFMVKSIVKVDQENWNKGQTYTCNITQETKEFSAKISICTAYSPYSVPSPSVYLEKPKSINNNDIVAKCTNIFPEEKLNETVLVIDETVEEYETDSLGSTAFTFIVLFLFTFVYSAFLSLHKLKQ
ncbi:hypothetical protein GN956_G7317 [Arapaima gigas]